MKFPTPTPTPRRINVIFQPDTSNSMYRVTLVPCVRKFKGQTSGLVLEPVVLEANSISGFTAKLWLITQEHIQKEVVVTGNEFSWAEGVEHSESLHHPESTHYSFQGVGRHAHY
jgi:hypothetical protein